MSIEERNRLVEENLNLIWLVLKRLGHQGNEDYFQQGVFQLMKCVENFDKNKGFAFSTYAVNSINLYLIAYIKRDKVIKPTRIRNSPNVKEISISSLDAEIKNAFEGTFYDYLGETDKTNEIELKCDIQNIAKNGIITEQELQILLDIKDGYSQKEIKQRNNLDWGQSKTSRNIAIIKQKVQDNLKDYR